MDVDKFEKITRPLVTLIVVSTLCLITVFLVYRFVDQLTSADVMALVNGFSALVLIVIGFWFNQRQAEKANEQVINQIKAIKEEVKPQ